MTTLETVALIGITPLGALIIAALLYWDAKRERQRRMR